jgi:hypothetical protein
MDDDSYYSMRAIHSKIFTAIELFSLVYREVDPVLNYFSITT